MSSLAVLLAEAARSADWKRDVIWRCAWCPTQPESLASVDRMRVVVSDGMCAACAIEALAQLANRRAARLAA